jgi:hypothetical protein
MPYKLSILFCVFLFISACDPSSKNSAKKFDPDRFIKEAYSKVTIADGIDEDEAQLLASAYFTTHIGGCGATTTIVDQGDKWEIKTVFGYAGTAYESIYVQKSTGIITCKKGPTIKPINY